MFENMIGLSQPHFKNVNAPLSKNITQKITNLVMNSILA